MCAHKSGAEVTKESVGLVQGESGERRETLAGI